ncbi:glycosyltransferase [Vibrio mediterranei]|uniref:glycosyltransferase n=1 Tax=Vibrio mediterranei TaxID=689 RepID=UPI0040676D83
MKKYTFIIDDLYGGGAEKVLLTVASLLKSQGHTVNVAILRDKVEHTIPDNLSIDNLNVINKFTKAFRSPFVRSFQVSKVQKYVDQKNSDVLICCSSEYVTSGVKHHNRYFWVHANQENSSDKHVEKLRSYYDGEKLLCVSQGVLDSILNLGVSPSFSKVLWNPIDKSDLDVRSLEKVDRMPASDYFVCVAALEERKGHKELLEAFARSQLSETLLLVGKGSCEDELKEQAASLGISDQVQFYGYTKNPYPLIKNAKALLLTSKREGAPLVLVEALMLNTTVLAMDCPSGPSEILGQANLSHQLINLGDIEGFSAGLKELSQHQDVIQEAQYHRFLPEVAIKQFEAL